MLAGGRRVDRPGFFMEPTLIEGSRELDANELFGPITTLHRVSGFEEAVELANATPYGLTAAIWTASVHRGQEFIARIRSGVAAVNGPTYGSEPHWPFGGVGDSGTGWREAGSEALDVYSDLKTVHGTTPAGCEGGRPHSARSGSVRVPDKNIRSLAGHPLVAWAIAGARAAASRRSCAPRTPMRSPRWREATAPRW